MPTIKSVVYRHKIIQRESVYEKILRYAAPLTNITYLKKRFRTVLVHMSFI